MIPSFTNEACRKCTMLPVCKIKDLFDENPILDFAMLGCRYYADGSNEQTVFYQPEEETESRDRLEVAQEIRASMPIEDDKEDIVPPSETLACSSCGKTGVQLIKCGNCDKYCCGDCITDTIDGKSLCPECYENEDETPIFSLK